MVPFTLIKAELAVIQMEAACLHTKVKTILMEVEVEDIMAVQVDLHMGMPQGAELPTLVIL